MTRLHLTTLTLVSQKLNSLFCTRQSAIDAPSVSAVSKPALGTPAAGCRVPSFLLLAACCLAFWLNVPSNAAENKALTKSASGEDGKHFAQPRSLSSIGAPHNPVLKESFQILSGPYGNKGFATVDKAVKANPKSALLHVYRGNAYLNEGDYENARKDFDLACTLDPKCAMAHIGRSRMYQAAEKFPLAFKELNIAAEIGSVDEAINALWESANIHMEILDYATSIKQYTAVLKFREIDPERRAVMLYQRGQCYHRMASLQNALADYTEVIKMNQGVDSAHYTRAQVLRGLHRYPEAIKEYSIAIDALHKTPFDSFDEKLITALNERASIYATLGKKNLAGKDIKEAERVDKARFKDALFRMDPGHMK